MIIVETEDTVYEYFLKYTLSTGVSMYNSEGNIDFSQFNGRIETFNSAGNLIGDVFIGDGNITNQMGQLAPCPDDPVDDPTNTNDAPTNDNTTSSSSTSAGVPGSDTSGTNAPNDNTGNGGFFASSDTDDCGLRWSYAQCGCGGTANGHSPSGPSCCEGSPLTITDCNGNVLAQRNNSDVTTMLKRNPIDPCDDGDVGVILKDDDCDTSKEDLKKVFPNMSDADAKLLAKLINEKGTDFGIDTKEKLWHFLAQAGHETGGFNNGIGREESLHYTTKSRLIKVFTSSFSNTDSITRRIPDSTYLGNSSKVANYVYADKLGNGNEASGEGYKYRGRGIFQLTGKYNYNKFKTWYNDKYDPDKDFVTNPELLKSNDTMAVLSAMWYYKKRVLDKITIDSTTTVKKITKKINGRGLAGIKDRRKRFKKAKDSITCIE
ncbi:glycoside hydrolase family 19 protein [Kordia sp.]|uniref:glycoside hydrolase family 19 protein n=1 Tax=Kordia sp. TaxID=1965332 RepID=UPI003D2CB6FF